MGGRELGVALIVTLVGGTAAARDEGIEQHVVVQMHHAHQFAISIGQLAQAKGDDKAVRNFGMRLVGENGAAEDHLAEWARRRSMHPAQAIAPIDMLRNQSAALEEVAYLEGDDFDRTFLRVQIKQIGDVIAAMREARASLVDPELKAMVTAEIERNQVHQALAGEILRGLKKPFERRN